MNDESSLNKYLLIYGMIILILIATIFITSHCTRPQIEKSIEIADDTVELINDFSSPLHLGEIEKDTKELILDWDDLNNLR